MKTNCILYEGDKREKLINLYSDTLPQVNLNLLKLTTIGNST